jgi:hypothetical protein
MKCPRCGEVVEPMDGETQEEFQKRYENDNCPCSDYS